MMVMVVGAAVQSPTLSAKTHRPVENRAVRG
jgi:hypothetical protein